MNHLRTIDVVGYGPMAVGAYGPQVVGVQSGPSLVGQGGMVPGTPGIPGIPVGAPMMPPGAHGFGGGHPYGHRGFHPMGHPSFPPGAWAPGHPHPYMGVPHIVNHPPTQVREFIIGFGPAPVNALSTAIFQAQPQLIFRGSQAVSANPIPAATFSELAVGVALGLDTATPGILITLSTSNTTNAQQTFSASLIGTSMQ
jgi:hypothetical protein